MSFQHARINIRYRQIIILIRRPNIRSPRQQRQDLRLIVVPHGRMQRCASSRIRLIHVYPPAIEQQIKAPPVVARLRGARLANVAHHIHQQRRVAQLQVGASQEQLQHLPVAVHAGQLDGKPPPAGRAAIAVAAHVGRRSADLALHHNHWRRIEIVIVHIGSVLEQLFGGRSHAFAGCHHQQRLIEDPIAEQSRHLALHVLRTAAGQRQLRRGRRCRRGRALLQERLQAAQKVHLSAGRQHLHQLAKVPDAAIARRPLLGQPHVRKLRVQNEARLAAVAEGVQVDARIVEEVLDDALLLLPSNAVGVCDQQQRRAVRRGAIGRVDVGRPAADQLLDAFEDLLEVVGVHVARQLGEWREGAQAGSGCLCVLRDDLGVRRSGAKHRR